MDFSFATEPAPGRVNEDHLLVSAGFAIVLDGVTRLENLDDGCRHGPAWLVRTLGAELVTALTATDEPALDQALAAAIDAVCRRHAGTCDLDNPNSPSSTVTIVRERGGQFDYLVLCDSAVVFDGTNGLTVINDDRTERLSSYNRHSVARLRNQPGGFWVASTAPEAAAEALTGTVPANDVRRLLLCTDGVSRLVDYFGYHWPDVFDMVGRSGPRAAIDAVRAAEHDQPHRLHVRLGRRVKQHDDATLAVTVS